MRQPTPTSLISGFRRRDFILCKFPSKANDVTPSSPLSVSALRNNTGNGHLVPCRLALAGKFAEPQGPSLDQPRIMSPSPTPPSNPASPAIIFRSRHLAAMDWAEPTGLDWAYSSPIRSSPLSGVVPPTSNSPKKNTAQERAHVRRSQPHSAFAASVDSMLATTEHYVARLAHEPSVGLYYIQVQCLRAFLL